MTQQQIAATNPVEALVRAVETLLEIYPERATAERMKPAMAALAQAHSNYLNSNSVTVWLSQPAIHMLEELTSYGVYGISVEEVAGRFVDSVLIDKAERGVVKIPDE